MGPANRTVSSWDFNQDIAGAKRAAQEGTVIVTDRGVPAFVLMTHADFQAMSGRRRTLIDILSDARPEADFDFERLTYPESRFVDFDTD